MPISDLTKWFQRWWFKYNVTLQRLPSRLRGKAKSYKKFSVIGMLSSSRLLKNKCSNALQSKIRNSRDILKSTILKSLVFQPFSLYSSGAKWRSSYSPVFIHKKSKISKLLHQNYFINTTNFVKPIRSGIFVAPIAKIRYTRYDSFAKLINFYINRRLSKITPMIFWKRYPKWTFIYSINSWRRHFGQANFLSKNIRNNFCSRSLKYLIKYQINKARKIKFLLYKRYLKLRLLKFYRKIGVLAAKEEKKNFKKTNSFFRSNIKEKISSASRFLIKKQRKLHLLYNSLISNHFLKSVFSYKTLRIKANFAYLFKIIYFFLFFNYKLRYFKRSFLYSLKKFFNDQVRCYIYVVFLPIESFTARYVARFIRLKLLHKFPVKNVLKMMVGKLNLGILAGEIAGFKLQLCGRFSRKDRATYSWKQLGKLSLNQINNHMDYSLVLVVLVNSICGIKVWLTRISGKERMFIA